MTSVEQHEATSAVGALGIARLEAKLSNQSCLLVANALQASKQATSRSERGIAASYRAQLLRTPVIGTPLRGPSAMVVKVLADGMICGRVARGTSKKLLVQQTNSEHASMRRVPTVQVLANGHTRTLADSNPEYAGPSTMFDWRW
jgi:hypothetical protein